MSQEPEELWVSLSFRGQDLDEFLAVKRYLGIHNHPDILRYLIRRQARALGHELEPRSAAAAGPGSDPAPDTPAAGLDAAQLCLDCPLPDCDESDPRCPYQQATGERDRRRERMRSQMRSSRASARARAHTHEQAHAQAGKGEE